MAGMNEPEIMFDRLYWMAVMKQHRDHNRISAGVYQSLLDETLTELEIDNNAFETYLDTHRDDLNLTMELVGI